MHRFLSVVFWVLIFTSISKASSFVTVGLGAGGQTTTGDLEFSSSGTSLGMGGGWEFGKFQFKGELFYFIYSDAPKYSTAQSRNLASAFLAALELGYHPVHFFSLSAGYGLGTIIDGQNWLRSGASYQEQKQITNGVFVAGADIWLFSNNKLDFGIQGRYFSLASNEYINTSDSGGSKLTTTVPSNSQSWGWFALGCIMVHFQ